MLKDENFSGLLRDFINAKYPDWEEYKLILTDYVYDNICTERGKLLRYFKFGIKMHSVGALGGTQGDKCYAFQRVLYGAKISILSLFDDYGTLIKSNNEIFKPISSEDYRNKTSDSRGVVQLKWRDAFGEVLIPFHPIDRNSYLWRVL